MPTASTSIKPISFNFGLVRRNLSSQHFRFVPLASQFSVCGEMSDLRALTGPGGRAGDGEEEMAVPGGSASKGRQLLLTFSRHSGDHTNLYEIQHHSVIIVDEACFSQLRQRVRQLITVRQHRTFSLPTGWRSWERGPSAAARWGSATARAAAPRPPTRPWTRTATAAPTRRTSGRQSASPGNATTPANSGSKHKYRWSSVGDVKYTWHDGHQC